jgi:ribonuclease III
VSNRIEAFEKRLGHVFADRDLIELALTHASHGDGRRRGQSNERLEFLGDRVLGLLAADRLYADFSQLDEGGLAHRLNALVSKTACARVARACGLGEALLLSPAEERLGGRDKESILGDACEAIIGALWLDGGMEAAETFFDAFWGEEIGTLKARPKDAKSRLQEWAASQGRAAPEYETVDRSGPDHRPVFTVQVAVAGLAPATGEGTSKQTAQRAAAAALLEREHADER